VIGPARQVCGREDQIDNHVECADQAKKTRPRDRQQLMVRREALENSQTGPCDVEGAVAIEQSLLALAADNGAETEIAITSLFLCRAPGRQGTGFEGGLDHA